MRFAVLMIGIATVVAADTYLDAYKEVHGNGIFGTTKKVKTDREYTESYPSTTGPEYGPPTAPPQYGPPSAPAAYGPPTGPPQYGPSGPYSYGPTAPVYGPPPHRPFFQEAPHAMLGILDKFKKKLDLFTVGKIVLKLILFKKFVAFLAIICLLLFLPYLKDKKMEKPQEDDEEEKYGWRRSAEEKVNTMAEQVFDALEKFSKNYTVKE